jgi:hypothetical protein
VVLLLQNKIDKVTFLFRVYRRRYEQLWQHVAEGQAGSVSLRCFNGITYSVGERSNKISAVNSSDESKVRSRLRTKERSLFSVHNIVAVARKRQRIRRLRSLDNGSQTTEEWCFLRGPLAEAEVTLLTVSRKVTSTSTDG